MKLNTISPGFGAKKKAQRVGRGIGSGLGKTCGRGHKGQKARAGGFHKINFEGGQMPIQRRLPKMGFKSRCAKYSEEVCLNDLQHLSADVITLELLKFHNIVSANCKTAKIILSGELGQAINTSGLKVSQGARDLIESLGGKVE